METVEFACEANVPMDIVLARRFPELSRRACRRLLQVGKYCQSVGSYLYWGFGWWCVWVDAVGGYLFEGGCCV